MIKEETRKSLELFVEKAHEISKFGFAKYISDGTKISLQTTINSNGEEVIEYIGPEEEAKILFAHASRLFTQDKDKISIRHLGEKLNDPALSLSWKKEIKDIRKHLAAYLSSPVSLPVVYAGEAPITHGELRDAFLYGDIAHLEERHRERLKRWKENNIIFEFYKLEFQLVLYTLLNCIMYISELCSEELRRNQ